MNKGIAVKSRLKLDSVRVLFAKSASELLLMLNLSGETKTMNIRAT